MIKPFLFVLALAFSSLNLLGQTADSFEDYVKENAWYISSTGDDKLTDSKNVFGHIDVKPTSFEMIPFQLDQKQFQYFIIGSSREVLVLKPMDLLEKEFNIKNQ